MSESKQDVIDDIARLIDRPARRVSTGSTEPKTVLTDILDVLARELPKPELAEFIARGGGEGWDSSCDSRLSPSGGGDTVTIQGLRRVRDSVKRILGRH